MAKIVLLIFVTFLITGCKNEKTPDISHINADVKIFRTEMEISKIKDYPQLEELIKSHPSFYNLYLNEILPIYKGNNKDSILMSFNFFYILKQVFFVHLLIPESSLFKIIKFKRK